ncbi:MAG TPA: alpha/beta family hydrolase [Vicinamibacterales bacterium]|nr:alpha/beta family hydrolase [Vicinamibacterales bacterium]
MSQITVVLAHGAGAGKDHPWMIRVARAFEAAGFRVVTFNFPYVDARRRVPDRPAVLEAHFAAIWRDAAVEATGPMFAAGKSMGGRIASQVAAKGDLTPVPAGLVFFGYPLHPPGKPRQRRDAHLPQITAPMLFLQGSKDPFGSQEEMGALVAGLPGARLSITEGGDHSLATSRKNAESVEAAVHTAIDWIRAATR